MRPHDGAGVVGTSAKSAQCLSHQLICMPSRVVSDTDGQVNVVLISRRYFRRRVTFRKELDPDYALQSLSQLRSIDRLAAGQKCWVARLHTSRPPGQRRLTTHGARSTFRSAGRR